MGTEHEHYARTHGARFDWHAHGFKSDPDGWEHHAFTVTITARGITESFDWRQGMAHEDEPTIGEVLPCLISDAHAGEMDFEDFCGEFGYDTDSRRAYATWEACKRTAEQLTRLFGEIPPVEGD